MQWDTQGGQICEAHLSDPPPWQLVVVHHFAWERVGECIALYLAVRLHLGYVAGAAIVDDDHDVVFSYRSSFVG